MQRRKPTILTLSIIALFCAGALQYIVSAFSGLSSGRAIYFTVDDDLTDRAGWLRYAKDVSVLIWGLFWPMFVKPKFRGILKIYIFWLLTLVVIGTVPLALGLSYLVFYVAGIRWVALVHASFGIYILCRQSGIDKVDENTIIRLLIVLSAVNDFFIIKQALAQGGLNFFGARYPGMFSNAGTAGYFTVALSLISLVFESCSVTKRTTLNAVCLLGAIGSGTRFAMLIVTILTAFVLLRSIIARLPALPRHLLILIFLLAAIPAAGISIYLANYLADRGDLSDQLSEGGRLYNLLELFSLVRVAGAGEVLIGQGLGVGTNSAFSALLAGGYNDNVVTWNMLLDNSIATTFIQIGLVGSLVFWGGISAIFATNISKIRCIIFAIFVVSLIVQNLAEQYFLVLCFAIALGVNDRTIFLIRECAMMPQRRSERRFKRWND